MVGKISLLIWVTMLTSYNISIVGIWWCAAFHGWACQIYLADIHEQYVEGIIWHGSLALFPLMYYQLLRALYPKPKPKNKERTI
jgi:hypothetical protein